MVRLAAHSPSPTRNGIFARSSSSVSYNQGMKQIPQFIFVNICLITSLAAQNGQSRLLDERWASFQHELMLRAMEERPSQVEREIAERKYAQYLERQFVAKMNRFIALWKALAEDYNAKSAFNVKLAKEVAKAFHDLESGEGWPKAPK